MLDNDLSLIARVKVRPWLQTNFIISNTSAAPVNRDRSRSELEVGLLGGYFFNSMTPNFMGLFV